MKVASLHRLRVLILGPENNHEKRYAGQDLLSHLSDKEAKSQKSEETCPWYLG